MPQTERRQFTHRDALKLVGTATLGLIAGKVLTEAAVPVIRRIVITEFEPDSCEGCATGGSYEELMRVYPGLRNKPVRMQEISTGYSQSTVYNAAGMKFNHQQAIELIGFYEQLAMSGTRLDLITPSKEAAQLTLEPTKFKRHTFFVVERADAINTPSDYAIGPGAGVHTWFNIGNGSTQTTIPIDRGMPVDDPYGMKYRTAIEKANAMFAVGTCDAVINPFDPNHETDIVLYAYLCSIIGRRVIYSDVKTRFGVDTFLTLDRYIPKSDPNRWDRVFQGQPGRGYVFSEK
ncbi:hypothetical protein A3D84_02060 [Candidatus Woesebacteria bacterium RIFCSPHIGHO2_02_FULL_42_20]|uniref:Uncharacterized protein n=1 Tax=Candidatus Woesebacteria bacterium RIFCSPHIGHO2_12_FULL_41_24 TaxID=1802510 RepID=A0A1F8AUD4_9BACT|nr:MAG: hypothetical protein A2W15_04340 [Candidatus Woesebacteria bacterium RBG_16_41_13]OGM30031.1 MAG: hypothetical protein A2873_04895 [Candidatus Woesebacteria bacterium RIFCSPHIGHO2_01_FULL_42_80]OGM35109.1 MAG: hypothetical protein A3D84_02060 [Candidatus Woesebacteria bacterium RIFCSPHIGHO2_02_FULL_42_20]OGM54845.1 MAG: hypothetical protein A3E44_01660 [Candidatus Woesebacteria bacterium RIFCSPHIGHO2_12_FULL_41_24]OGM67461.1 MAG: hypothetical protein A2969_05510 [Candidatus Woesebacteri